MHIYPMKCTIDYKKLQKFNRRNAYLIDEKHFKIKLKLYEIDFVKSYAITLMTFFYEIYTSQIAPLL